MSLELKIKAKSLADEARTIRIEERKLKARRMGPSREYASLYLHRVGIVRREARATHLARAYISGLRYRQVEQTTHQPLSPEMVARVVKMLDRFGHPAGLPEFVAWISEPPAAAKKAA